MTDRTFERIDTLFDIASFANVRVLVAGCGSGGASVALQLVMSGIRNFTLIDNDVLGPENVIRHVCGRRYIGQKKVDAVADVLLDRNPKANINKIDADIMAYPDLAAEIAKADVAHGVAASAAYPLFLPAFDETLTFEKDGALKTNRVILTDGGIYDNLGLGCLWSDRLPDVSLNVIPVDTIIFCSAGYGLRQDPPSQFMFARLLTVFGTIFDRAQNASIHRLHEAQRTGQIKSFIFPYLGQLDRQLPNPPANLVRREEAHAYPTDFSAMPDEWIERLSLRGEQLTLCLARAYIPDLIREPGAGPHS